MLLGLTCAGFGDETQNLIKRYVAELGDNNPAVADGAAKKLMAQDRKTVVQFINETVESPQASDLQKCNAIYMLGEMDSKESASQLINVLDEKKPIVQKEAIKALKRIKAKGATNKLRSMLTTEKDPSVLNEAVKALGDLDAGEAAGELMDTVRNSKFRADGYGPVLKESAIESLGKLKSKNATGLLTDILAAKEDLMIKDKAAWALGEIGDPAALAELELHLKKLEEMKPVEDIFHYKWEESVNITKQAIEKIKNKPE